MSDGQLGWLECEDGIDEARWGAVPAMLCRGGERMKYLLTLLLAGCIVEVIDAPPEPCEHEYHEVVIGGKIECAHEDHYLVYEKKPDRYKVWCICEGNK